MHESCGDHSSMGSPSILVDHLGSPKIRIAQLDGIKGGDFISSSENGEHIHQMESKRSRTKDGGAGIVIFQGHRLWLWKH